MSFKTILVPFYCPDDSAALRTALELIKQNSGHLEAVNITPDPHDSLLAYAGGVFWPADYPDQLMAELVSESKRKLHDARSLFTRIADDMKIDIAEEGEVANYPSARFSALTGQPAKIFATRARLADLIVMNRSFGKDGKGSGMIQAALFRSGCPVLLVPPGNAGKPLPDKVLIAWNGSFEASRAVRLALPFLKNAKVRIFAGIEGEEAPGVPAQELVNYLNYHGIAADMVTPVLDETCEEAIKKAAAAFDAGLLVMGAFSRQDRLRETLLGSLTDEVLKTANIPVLMAN